MKVYIVNEGEQYEGSAVVKVFEYKEDAIEFCKSLRTNFDGGWTEEASEDPSILYYADNGCDFSFVQEFEVTKKDEDKLVGRNPERLE